MRPIDTEELKKIQLEILDTVATFCDEYNIKYWLYAGTLLGAIRHKGYIPWDDDIDLGMLKKDYDRFAELFNKSNTRYKLISFENAPESFLYFAKVIDTSTVLYEPDETGIKLAIYVDIFIINNAPDDDKIVQKMFKFRDICIRCNLGRKLPLFTKPTRGGLLRRLAVYGFRLMMRVFPRYYFVRKIIENSRRYAEQETKRFGDFLGENYVLVDKSVLDVMINCEFEGKNYKIPAEYDTVLRKLYGDYMQLPPEEKRVSTHKFKAYHLESSERSILTVQDKSATIAHRTSHIAHRTSHIAHRTSVNTVH